MPTTSDLEQTCDLRVAVRDVSNLPLRIAECADHISKRQQTAVNVDRFW